MSWDSLFCNRAEALTTSLAGDRRAWEEQTQGTEASEWGAAHKDSWPRDSYTCQCVLRGKHYLDVQIPRNRFLICASDNECKSRKHKLYQVFSNLFFFPWFTKLWVSQSEALLQQRLTAVIRETCKVKYTNPALEDGLQFFSIQSCTITMKMRQSKPFFLRTGANQHSVLRKRRRVGPNLCQDVCVSLTLLIMYVRISSNYHTKNWRNKNASCYTG